MPLERPDIPSEVWSSAFDHHAAGPDWASWIRARLRRRPKLEWPHEIYVIADVHEGATIAAMARAVGWRFIEVSRAEPAAVEVSEYERRQVVEVERGPVVRDSVIAFEDARRQLADSQSPFVPRLLRAPALHVTAVWLHTDAAGDDLLFPLDSLHEELEALRPVPPARFAEVLASLDRAMRTAYEEAGPAREDLGG